MEKVLHVIDRISHWSGEIASYLLPGLVFVMMYEVIARYVFNSPTEWAFEMSSFLTGSLGALGGGYGLLYHSHVVVDVIYDKGSDRAKAIMKIVGFFLLVSFLFMLLYIGYPRAVKSLVQMEGTDTPWNPKVWPVRFAIPIGATLVLLQATANMIRNWRVAITGKGQVV